MPGKKVKISIKFYYLLKIRCLISYMRVRKVVIVVTSYVKSKTGICVAKSYSLGYNMNMRGSK